MRLSSASFTLSALALGCVWAVAVSAWTPKAVVDDPLVRMPGTQPGTVALESAGRCMNCHGGIDAGTFYSVGRRWQGSMMGMAARDPLFYACLTAALQDSVWAVGNPNAGDLCMRCHFPKGWLEGRSDPVNASAMTAGDYDGVHCDLCHSLFDPFFEDTYAGTREGNDWVGHWDEATAASLTGANATRAADKTATGTIKHFNGQAFYDPATYRPVSSSYTENGLGQYFVSVPKNKDKRASFVDASARHNFLYSRHHKSRDMCSVCHDVSNPVLQNLGANPANPLPTEIASAASYFHVERTFSEFKCSGYGQTGGMTGTGPYAPAGFTTSHPGNRIASCQDCHFADTVGRACTQVDGVVRPTNSSAHPKSGQPSHDMMGGNVWVPYILASTVLNSPNYSATNAALLTKGPAVLTLDLSQGEPLNDGALLEASARAQASLERAAGIDNVAYDPVTGLCSFHVNNHTGHKLISGFPEGRRMFVNIRAFVGGTLVYEVNPYDAQVGTLKGLPRSYSPSSPPLARHEAYDDELVYEVHPSSSLTGEAKTFHFALATGRTKDNRIPPRGFDVGAALMRKAEPVWHGVSVTNYFTSAEYAGGYDDATLQLPRGAERVELRLYYQSTSREYIAFLRDEINGTATTLVSPTPSGEARAYIAQTDPFFAKLKAWGTTIWELWWNNRGVPGAAPVPIADMDLQLDTSDTDGDGLPAYWELLHFGSTTGALPGDDWDNDGRSNADEYVALTDPRDPGSILRIHDLDVARLPAALVAQVAFTSYLARAYALEHTTNILAAGSWTAEAPPRRGVEGADHFMHTNAAPSMLYRLTVRLP